MEVVGTAMTVGGNTIDITLNGLETKLTLWKEQNLESVVITNPRVTNLEVINCNNMTELLVNPNIRSVYLYHNDELKTVRCLGIVKDMSISENKALTNVYTNGVKAFGSSFNDNLTSINFKPMKGQQSISLPFSLTIENLKDFIDDDGTTITFLNAGEPINPAFI